MVLHLFEAHQPKKNTKLDVAVLSTCASVTSDKKYEFVQ